jgi:23S rRNA (cytidine2498-2'-O)-methyltransferase
MTPTAQFLFVTCQIGAEAAVKKELARDFPQFRFAYSRPGFLTFKLPPEQLPAFDLRSVFARAYGLTLGKVTGDSPDRLSAAAKQLAGEGKFTALHVWQRDTAPVGFRGFEPGATDAVIEAQAALQSQFTALPVLIPLPHVPHPDSQLPSPHPGDLVLDCILVEPTEWWLGFHQIDSAPSRWPGGIFAVAQPPDMVSRAYVKMREALAWSRLPVRRGDTVAEIGSAPGGASQALLEKGLAVIGIDPAKMDERVVANAKFTHIQKRGHEVRRRQFRDVRWLAADINVAPDYTLETVEGIVTHAAVNIEGLLLTLKLLEWKLADNVPAYLDRVRSWGYRHVAARQLSHNRQEICVAASRR